MHIFCLDYTVSVSKSYPLRVPKTLTTSGLPKKLYSYEKNTLALLPRVLDEMENGPVSVGELYLSMKRILKDPTDFLSAMDCLYAQRAIDMNDDGEVFICLKK